MCALPVCVCGVCVCGVYGICTAGSQAKIDQHSLNKQKRREDEVNMKTKEQKSYKGVTDVLRHVKSAVYNRNTRTPSPFAVTSECE